MKSRFITHLRDSFYKVPALFFLKRWKKKYDIDVEGLCKISHRYEIIGTDIDLYWYIKDAIHHHGDPLRHHTETIYDRCHVTKLHETIANIEATELIDVIKEFKTPKKTHH